MFRKKKKPKEKGVRNYSIEIILHDTDETYTKTLVREEDLEVIWRHLLESGVSKMVKGNIRLVWYPPSRIKEMVITLMTM